MTMATAVHQKTGRIVAAQDIWAQGETAWQGALGEVFVCGEADCGMPVSLVSQSINGRSPHFRVRGEHTEQCPKRGEAGSRGEGAVDAVQPRRDNPGGALKISPETFPAQGGGGASGDATAAAGAHPGQGADPSGNSGVEELDQSTHGIGAMLSDLLRDPTHADLDRWLELPERERVRWGDVVWSSTDLDANDEARMDKHIIVWGPVQSVVRGHEVFLNFYDRRGAVILDEACQAAVQQRVEQLGIDWGEGWVDGWGVIVYGITRSMAKGQRVSIRPKDSRWVAVRRIPGAGCGA